MSERRRSMSEQHKPRDFELTDPTPEHIEERTAQIRQGWSKGVTSRRQAWADPSWRPPLIMTIDIVRQLNERQE